MGRFKIRKHWNYYLIIVALGLQLYSTQCLPGITYDSKQYLSAADSFAQSRQLLNEKGKPHLAHTPLYAVTLSWLGANRLQWAKYLNTICLGITLLLFVYLGNCLLHNAITQWVFSMLLVIATPLQLIHHFVWSEPLFLTFLAVLLVLFYHFLQKPTPQVFWGMVPVAFLLCMQRNPGIFIIVGVALSFWWFSNVRWWKVALWGLVSISGWAVWTVYTYQTNQAEIQPAFHNVLGELLLRHNLDHHLNVLSSWLLPLTISLIIRGVILLLFVGLLIVSAMYGYVQITQFTKALFTIGVVYMICLQFTERVDYHETTRYLAVIFPLVLLAMVESIELLGRRMPLNITQLSGVLLLCWLLYPIGRTWKNVTSWHQISCKANLLEKSDEKKE
ncbi:MAG TPA: hypothetical protein DCS93_16810 [Microscillaceae bacterium]|nr:hypothetical protein [Microscillaceae bacterium]